MWQSIWRGALHIGENLLAFDEAADKTIAQNIVEKILGPMKLAAELTGMMARDMQPKNTSQVFLH